jgi:hypothetical protein
MKIISKRIHNNKIYSIFPFIVSIQIFIYSLFVKSDVKYLMFGFSFLIFVLGIIIIRYFSITRKIIFDDKNLEIQISDNKKKEIVAIKDIHNIQCILHSPNKYGSFSTYSIIKKDEGVFGKKVIFIIKDDDTEEIKNFEILNHLLYKQRKAKIDRILGR